MHFGSRNFLLLMNAYLSDSIELIQHYFEMLQ